MPKSVKVLTVKEVEAGIKELVADGMKNYKKKARLTVGGCVGGGIDISFEWKGDECTAIRKVWSVRYTFDGKPRATTFGTYGDKNSLTLPEFREKVNDFQKQIKAGVDVIGNKKQQQKETVANERTVGDVAGEYFRKKKTELSPLTIRQEKIRYNAHFSELAKLPLKEVTRRQVIDFLSKFNDKGATRAKLIIIGNGIFKFAIANEYTESNPFAGVSEALPKRPPEEHFPTLTDPVAIGQLIRHLQAYGENNPILAGLALFSIYTLCRQQEARFAKWEQIDFDARLWVIPAEVMKARKEHKVPLSTGAMDILKQMQETKLHSDLIFASPRFRPFSDNACRVMLRSLGYTNEQLVPHGFRAMGSTQLNELNYPRDWVDISLAHAVGNEISQAYNHSLLLEQRRDMLEKWYCYLCALRDGVEVNVARNKYQFTKWEY